MRRPASTTGGYRLGRYHLTIGSVVLISILATPGRLARLPLRAALKQTFGLSPAEMATFFAVVGVAWYVKPLAGLLCDRVSLLGDRRRPYILIAGVGGAAGWLAAALVWRDATALLGAMFVINVFAVLSNAAVGGLLVDLGRRYRDTASFSATRMLALNLAALISGPVGGWLACSWSRGPATIPNSTPNGVHVVEDTGFTLSLQAATTACTGGIPTMKARNEMRRIMTLSLVIGLCAWQRPARADFYETYSAGSAVSYALYNYNRPYGTDEAQNRFTDYSWVMDGGNCANFVSQAILGGLVDSNQSWKVHSSRYEFDVDRFSDGGLDWYFISDGDRGAAWAGAHYLYEYAKFNKPSYQGLHFAYVTHDTLISFMDYEKVEPGDVVFADWDHDDWIDHAMIVTDFRGKESGYEKVRLTYQGADGVVGKSDIGLGWLNEETDYEAVFYVYRPTDYNPAGL